MQDKSNKSEYFFHEGTNFFAYEYLGCNLSVVNGIYRYSFRVWAPNARAVALVSDFSGWDSPYPMRQITQGGVYECYFDSPVSLEKKAYKFKITASDGRVIIKGDPYARFSRGLDDGASLIFLEPEFKWSDAAWYRHRRATVKEKKGYYIPSPINIYEVHAGSFLRHDEVNSPLSYRELADVLVPYVKSMGYTHVELLPIMEHPYDASWGYQICAFYAPSSRYGDPDDFAYLVNELHRAGIGIILDWVPAHFPKDEWGLYEFDGMPLYEYQGLDRQESRSWGTRFFDLGREEIQSFLISNALYYFRRFHIDGLRVDAVASMLYLDYDRLPGEWIPSPDGSNINREAEAFLRKLNTAIYAEFPDVLMIAEESGSHGGVTRPVSDGGLGFNMKWNMGFANDLYEYMSLDPVYRRYNHKALNFPIMYAFSENYCLPISHDEVVHGKRSFIDKMFGGYEDKFAQARAAMLFFATFPGKKLTFMGTEFAQFREWDYENSLEWFMLEYKTHNDFREYVRSLNELYLSTPALYEIDFSQDGFCWLLPDAQDKNVVAYRRLDASGKSVIVIINFSGAEQRLTIPLNPVTSVDTVFTSRLTDGMSVGAVEHCGDEHSAEFILPAFFGAVYKEKIGKINIKI